MGRGWLPHNAQTRFYRGAVRVREMPMVMPRMKAINMRMITISALIVSSFLLCFLRLHAMVAKASRGRLRSACLLART